MYRWFDADVRDAERVSLLLLMMILAIPLFVLKTILYFPTRGSTQLLWLKFTQCFEELDNGIENYMGREYDEPPRDFHKPSLRKKRNVSN